MSLTEKRVGILNESVYTKVFQSQKDFKSPNISAKFLPVTSTKKSANFVPAKGLCNSRSSDSGKSSSCSPILGDCSFDSGIAGVFLLDSNAMQLQKRIQQCQCILLALERDQEYFLTIRNRLSKITNRKQKQTSENEFFCNVCCGQIDLNDETTYVKCYICEKYICRNSKCSDCLGKTAKWECELCQTSKESLAQTSSWVADQITFNQKKLICSPTRARSEVYIPISEYNDSLIQFESISQIGVNSNAITAEQKFKIREYVEEVVAKLLGGNLDTIAVNQLSKSENYLNLFHKYHPKLSNILINLEKMLTHNNKGDLPDRSNKNIHNGTSHQSNGHDFSDISETRLRQMIETIIAETINLTPLTNGHAVSEIALDRRSRTIGNGKLESNGYHPRHRTEHYFEPTIYQDLLATAVLNKIVNKQLNSKQNVAERDVGDGCGDDPNDNIRLASTDQNCNVEKLSTSSGSSVEPRSDCSYPEVEQILNNNDDKSSEIHPNSDRDSVMSDYLANHMIPLPDLNAIATESEEDDYTSVTSNAIGDGTWEKNWLFKKKKSPLSASVTSSSIGILVPDPKEDVRAQIGDKTTDEVSDLSEIGSDSDDSLNSLRSQLDPINDRLMNKHLIGGQNSKIILDELIERSSMISNTFPSEVEATDACNENIIDATTKSEAINANVSRQQSTTDKLKESSRAGDDFSINSLTGSIAEREYKKWSNAVEMPNNPYAPEALKRRISGSQERFIDLPNITPTKDLNPSDFLNDSKLDIDENVQVGNDYKRYSRDYYINSTLKTSEMSLDRDVSVPSAKDNREDTKTMTSSSSTEKETEIDLYKAIPVQVIEDNLSQMETISFTPIEMRSNLTSASDDSDTIKINDSVKPLDENAEKKRRKFGEIDSVEKICNLTNKRQESSGNIITPTRGSTPVAFKFLQPKRKLLEPNQVLTTDEEEPQPACSQWEKPVIEAEIVKALPSVKALARAFLMTTNTTQPEKLWLRKSKTLSQGGKKFPTSSTRSVDQIMKSERFKPEDDVTITSDLSSLETDSCSVGTEMPSTSNVTPPTVSSVTDPINLSVTGNISPVPVRQGVLKNNIAFFENLKNN